MSLNVRARRCCSALPSTFARADRSPSATRRAAWSSRRDRPGDLARDQRAGAEAEHEHEQADRDQAERRPSGGAVDGAGVLGDPDGADRLAHAGAQDGHRGGEDRLAQGLAVALLLVGVAAERGRDLGPAAVVEADPLLARGVGDAAGRRDRPRSRVRARCRAARSATSSRPSGDASSSSTLIATISAWLSACDSTSASTRSRMLMMRGTSRAITASTSTYASASRRRRRRLT